MKSVMKVVKNVMSKKAVGLMTNQTGVLCTHQQFGIKLDIDTIISNWGISRNIEADWKTVYNHMVPINTFSDYE